jgi:DNA (cytosine-5)-methyltransferase 1
MGGPAVGSLCSGYLGLDAAVCAVLGARVAWVCETDANAARIIRRHLRGVPNHGDISGVDWAAVQPVDILTSGFPCQPWSDAGSRGGIGDARDLWPAVAAAVRALRPRLVVLENVAGFARRPAGFGRTADDLAALGYVGRWTRLRAADVGAPHIRDRWFAIAWPAADAHVLLLAGRATGGAGAADEPGAGPLAAPA